MEFDSPGEAHKLQFFDYHCKDLWGCCKPEGQRGELVSLGSVYITISKTFLFTTTTKRFDSI